VENTEWKYYPWDLITTVAITEKLDPEFFCKAHQENVRVVFLADYPVNQLSNHTFRKEWIESLIIQVKDTYTDGVNVDVESVIPNNSNEKHILTLLMRELKNAFHSRIPGTQISFDVAWSPNCIDGRCYDYAGLSQESDFLFVMDYDLRSQIFGPCIASANAPLSLVEQGMKNFTSLGISPNKLILGVPWYGYDYTCINPSNETICPIKYVPFRGVNCSDAAGNQRPYSNVKELLKNSTSGRHWDNTLKAPYFNLRVENQMHQIWYDDPESLVLKYQWAKSMNLRGVGMWTADFLDYENNPKESKEMWDTMRKFK